MQEKPDKAALLVFLIISIIVLSAIVAFRSLIGVLIVSASFSLVLMPVQKYLGNIMGCGLSAAVITAGFAFFLLRHFILQLQ